MTTTINDLHIDGYERVVEVKNETVNLYGYIALHNLNLGPGLGGVRHKPYSSGQEALDDVLELSRAMSLKSSLAEINYGGGKGVIMQVGKNVNRSDIYQAFGEAVEMLGGSYIAVGDVGTSPDDLKDVQETTSFCAGTELDSGIPTAKGVYYAIEAYLHYFDMNFEGLNVAVMGLGKVGGNLASILGGQKISHLYAADVSAIPFESLHEKWCFPTRLSFVNPEVIHARPCEIFAPCALGHAVNRHNRHELNCNAIIGAANNIVDDLETIRFLHRRGITYLPDFLVNAGGVLALAAEIENRMHTLEGDLQKIGDRVHDVLERKTVCNVSEWTIATELAWDRIFGE